VSGDSPTVVAGTPARSPLTRTRIVEAAIAIADRQGLDDLTMRLLARNLGFEVMSLYNHVANKDALHAAMVDHVVLDITLIDDNVTWKQAIRATMLSAHAVTSDHPWVAALWSRVPSGPARLRFMEDLLRTLARAPIDDTVAHHGYHALSIHLLGYALQVQHMPFTIAELPAAASEFLTRMDGDTYPHLIAHVRQHVDEVYEGDFEFTLDLLLDGLESNAAPRR
jgi:AcrR family transcriptional regulator